MANLYEKIGKVSVNIALLYEKNKKDIRINFYQSKLNRLIKLGLIMTKQKRNLKTDFVDEK